MFILIVDNQINKRSLYKVFIRFFVASYELKNVMIIKLILVRINCIKNLILSNKWIYINKLSIGKLIISKKERREGLFILEIFNCCEFFSILNFFK